MTNSDHERAREFLLLRDIEGISDSDATWVESHLTCCPECSSFVEELELAERALRSIPVTATLSLVSATQTRVRRRAAELRDQQARNFLIGISFCLGLLWSAGSVFVGLKLSGWLADKIHVASWIIATALVVFWLAPAVAIAIGLLVHSPLSNPARTDWLAARFKEDLL
jgi:anti-sigma factor RsiW